MSDEEQIDYDSPTDERDTKVVNKVILNKAKGAGILKAIIGLMLFIGVLYFVLSGSVDEAAKQTIGSVKIKSAPTGKELNPADFSAVDESALKDMKIDQEVVAEKNENAAKSVVLPTAVLLAEKKQKEPTDEELIKEAIKNDEIKAKRERRLNFGTVRVSSKYMKSLQQRIDEVLSPESLAKLSAIQNRTYAYVSYQAPIKEKRVIDKYDINNYNNILPKNIKYLKVIPGVLILGHDSDGGKEMIAEVLSGNYKGARLFGNVSVSTYVEKAFIKFTVMSYKDELYNISALAVDSNTNIPSIPGKVDKHWIHNVVYGFGVGFLDAYSAVRGVQGQYNNATSSIPGIGLVDSVSVDTNALVQSTTSSAVSKTISSLGQYRKPTYTKKAYTSIGLVFLPNGSRTNVANNKSSKNNNSTNDKGED